MCLINSLKANYEESTNKEESNKHIHTSKRQNKVTSIT
jgi:hypothetical protein